MSLVLLCVSLAFSPSTEAALCPAASASTICFDFTEGTPGTSGAAIVSTTVTPSKNNVALPPVVLPASSVTGGQTKFHSIATVECQSDTYAGSAFTTYTISGVSFNSLSVTATPGVGVIKNRTGEAVCTTPPSGFSAH